MSFSSYHCETFPKEINKLARIFPRFPKEIQIIKLQKGAKLTHAETFVSVLKKARLKINNPAYIDLVISSERLLHLPEDGGLSDITTLQFIDKHHPQ